MSPNNKEWERLKRRVGKFFEVSSESEKIIENAKSDVHSEGMSVIIAFEAWRKSQKISQRQAAKAIGISPMYLSDIENFRRDLSVEVASKIKAYVQ